MKYKSEFMKSLGQYVYAYSAEGNLRESILNNTVHYSGVGVKNRCLDHTKEESMGGKDYDPDNLFIIAHSLEKYAETTKVHEIASFAIEALTIALTNPKDNKVKGRYGELMVLQPITEIFNEWQLGEIDPVAEGFKFYEKYPELRSVTTGTKSNSEGTEFSTRRIEGTEYKLCVTYGVDSADAHVKVNFSKKYKGKEQAELFELWAKQNKDQHIEASAAQGEYMITNFESAEDAKDYYVEAAAL